MSFYWGLDKQWLKERVVEVLNDRRIPAIATMEEVMQFLEDVYNKYRRGTTLYIYTEYRKQVEERAIANIIALNEKKLNIH